MTAKHLESRIARHYAAGGLLDSILGALRESGKDPDRLQPDDLKTADGFHVGGRATTRQLADRVAWTADTRVLDAGCGIGGSARFLAAEYGCRVDGIDLTPEYIDAARDLTRRVGLADRITYHEGDVTALPFENDLFDAAWTEHVQMNIEDKRPFYAEIHRVLQPDGRLLFHDVFAGDVSPPHYPVPWSNDASTSHLAAPDAVRDLLRDLGFGIDVWDETTDFAAAWFRKRLEAFQAHGAFPPLGTHLLMGPNAAEKAKNMGRNLAEHRCRTIQAVVRKPA